MPTCRRAIVLAGALVLPLAAAACSLVPTPGQANLAPTLSLQDEPGGVVAFESGQPVPTFDRQPRLVVDLDGAWRFDPQKLDIAASLTDRKSSLSDLTAELAKLAWFFELPRLLLKPQMENFLSQIAPARHGRADQLSLMLDPPAAGLDLTGVRLVVDPLLASRDELEVRAL